MQTRVAGGTAPDCYELNIENFASYANKGVLAEITDVDLSSLDETALSAFNVDGKQYGLPGNFSNVVLVYNKDLFDQAGIDYPNEDWTQGRCAGGGRGHPRPGRRHLRLLPASYLQTSSTRPAPSSAAAC